MKAVGVPLLGEAGPYTGELREEIGAEGCTALAWACPHAHPDRQAAAQCAEAELARIAPKGDT